MRLLFTTMWFMPSLHEEGLGSGCCFASYCIRESRNWRAPLNWTADRGTPTPSLLQSLLLLHVGPRSDHLQLMSPSQTINGQTNYPLTTVMRMLIFIFFLFLSVTTPRLAFASCWDSIPAPCSCTVHRQPKSFDQIYYILKKQFQKLNLFIK